MGSSTKEEALEILRKKTVLCMGGFGKQMVINVDTFTPDWKTEFTAGADVFPTACVFNKEEWAKTENHMKIVREEENKSIMGDAGQFAFKPDFNITICAKYTSDEDCQKLLGNMPNPEAWAKFVIS